MKTGSDVESLKPLGLWSAWKLIRVHREPRFRMRVVLTVVLLLLERLAVLGAPYLFSRMVAHLSGTGEAEGIIFAPVWLIAAYGLLIVIRSVFSALQELAYQPVSQRVQRLIAQTGLRHLHQLSLRFHLDRQTGALTRAIERGSEGADTLLRLSLFNIGPALLDTILTIGVVLHLFGWAYGAVIAAAMVSYIALAQWFVRRRVAARRNRNEASGRAQHLLLDSLLNFEAVRHFRNEDHEHDRYESARRDQEQASLRMTLVAQCSSVSQNAMIALATGTILLMAAHDIAHHKLDVAQFVLIGTYLRSLYQAIVSLNVVYAGWRNARVDLEHLLDVLGTAPELEDGAAGKALPLTWDEGGPANVAFESVSFGYRPDREILHGISFDIRGGQTLAIVGATGSGKSTLGRLLVRAYDPTDGRITIDGEDLRDMSQSDIRAMVGVVPQEPTLFNDTIGYNIRYARLNATTDEVERAARIAQIHGFIENLPDGYDTRIGERGMKLSGGERQRIAMARVVLKDPRILLLDEATSALDTMTETRILDGLRRVSHRRTTIAIAHRLSTVRDADRILVLAKGRIVESGRHEQLLAMNGHYARMWHAQARFASGLPGLDNPPESEQETSGQERLS